MKNNKLPKINDLPESSDRKSKIKCVILTVILWLLMVFEVIFVYNTMQNWADPYYLSSSSIIGNRWGEIIAFALCVIMILYTAGISVLMFIFGLKNKFKGNACKGFSRMHTLALVAFLIHWLIFSVVFLIF